MKIIQNILSIIVLLVFAVSCKTIDIPSKEESERVINGYGPLIQLNNSMIDQAAKKLPGGKDVIIMIRKEAINRILKELADDRYEDVKIEFLPTRHLIEDKVSLPGMEYTNYLDIDGGDVALNLKTFRFNDFKKDLVGAEIEIVGKGKISVSGKYTVLKASASLEIELKLKENVRFIIRPAAGGGMELAPLPQKIKITATFFVQLFSWKIPYSHDIELQLADLIKPVEIPMAIQTEINLPVPAKKQGDDKFENVRHKLDLNASAVSADQDILEYGTNIKINKK